MKTLGYYNGRFDELDRMTVPMLDRGCYFGDGVYDVTYCRNYHIYALDEHISRFFQSAEKLAIKLDFDEAYLASLLQELVIKLDSPNQWVYFQVTRGTELRNHAFPTSGTPNLWVMLKPAEIRDTYQPMRCITMEDTRHHHCDVKSLNLLVNVLATQATVEAGVDECILHRGDTVTECAHSNLSILKDGVLLTHPADEYILAGTGRAHLLNACRTLAIPVSQTAYSLTELMQADEILITSASALCMRVIEIDGTPVGGKAAYTVKQLQDLLLADYLQKTE